MLENTQSVIRVKVLPRSSRNQVACIQAQVFRIKLTSPPVDGKANKALVQFLAKKLGVTQKNVEITAGKRSREKKIRIYGLSPQDITERLLNGAEKS